MSSDMHLPWDCDVSESEGTQGEDIEGAEYADRSVDGSQSGQSLQGFFDDQDSGSIQGPSFYWALNNEGVSPTSPVANWSINSAFRELIPVSPSNRCKRKFSNGEGERCPEGACLEEDIVGVVFTMRALERKRRRPILSQEIEEAEEEHVPTPQPFSHVLERGQDVRLRLQGNPAEDLSSAASPPPDAEAGKHSAAPNFDPPSHSATCASVGDELGVATGDGHDVCQQSTGSAAGELHYMGPSPAPPHPADEPRSAATEPTPSVKAARRSESWVPKARQPVKKKSHKRAKPISAPVDEAARAEIRAAREAHFRTLEGLKLQPNGQEVMARPMSEAQGGGHQAPQEAVAAEALGERSCVDVTVAEGGEEDQQGGEHLVAAVRQSVQHSPWEALRQAEELERRQDARQRLQGTLAANSSDASSRSPVAEAGEPSAVPNFDARSRLATCTSIEDDCGARVDENQSTRQQLPEIAAEDVISAITLQSAVRQSLRGIAVGVVSRAARPSSVVDADQPSIAPNRNEPSLEDKPERSQDARQRLQGIPSDDLSSAASLPPGAEANEPSAPPDFDPPARFATLASVEADPEAGRGEGHDERQQLQAIADEDVSRATTPPLDIMAGQPSTAPNQNEPPRSGNEASIEDEVEGSQDERQQLRGIAAQDFSCAPISPPVVDAGQPSTAPTRNDTSRPRDQAFVEDDASSVDPRLCPGEIVVHSEHDGKLLTVKKAELGTFLFAKRKFDDKVDYQDAKNGPQGCCRRYGEVLGHQVEIRRLRPSREFGSYPDWPSAYPKLRGEPHLEEAIKAGCPCKPYLDLERDGGLPDGETLETVIDAFEGAITGIFESEYGQELSKEAFNWIPCDYGPGGKFSLHLVISSHSPQFVYRSNLAPPADPQGAGHLARKLSQLLPDRYAELIDQSVYTRNRGIRLPFCSKPSNPRSRLIPLDESKPYADACITWFDDHVQTINVPDVLFRAVRSRERPENSSHLNPKAASMYEVQRCTELIQNLHPTAYRRGSANSLNYSWHDRSEPCYSGNVHAGGRDILCVADRERNAVFAVCSSERFDPETGVCCKDLPAKYLGPYWVDNKTWKDGAVEIDMEYLDRDPLAAAPMNLALIRAGVSPLTDKVVFNDIVNKWLEGRYKALPIRSPMGSGKSTLLAALLAEVSRFKKVCMITYRRTQALDAAGKHQAFSHYEDLKQADGRMLGDRFIPPLADRELHPRVIVQLDSLPGLIPEDDEDAPAFDLLVLDESESILAHFSADTLRERHRVIQLLVEMMRRARRIVCLDGHLGQRTYEFLTMNEKSYSPVVINKHAPERPLEIEFLQGKNEGLAKWEGAIFEALGAGRNVFVASMSSEKAQELGATVVERGLVEGDQVLIITRHSDGAVKRGLQDVNRQWRKRLVIISPTVEAGVDFNQDWFHQMFLYVCQKSTHPRGLDQMKGRVRKLANPRVLCYVQEGIWLPVEPGPSGGGSSRETSRSGSKARLGVEETYQWFLNQNCRGGLNCVHPITRLLAHNEKEIFNGQTHFCEEFTDLLQADGHVIVKNVCVDEEAVEVNAGPSEEGGRGGKYLLEEMISAPNISHAQFVDIERRSRKYEDRPGETVQMEKFQLARFYDVPYLSEEFLRTFGPKPIHALDFLEQVVDEDFKYDRNEIGRHMYPPQMTAMARELLTVMGFEHALDAAHETDTLSTMRSRLAGTAFFRNYSENVKLFHHRAASVSDVLVYQKTATIALNHVFSALGLHLEAKKLGRLEVRDVQRAENGNRKRLYRYGGWFLSREPLRTTRPVQGPPGVNLMCQLFKLRLADSEALRERVPPALREYLDGIPFQWRELVQHRRCGIIVGPGEE